MNLWYLALKARKVGNWPRTFYTGLTVLKCLDIYLFLFQFLAKQSALFGGYWDWDQIVYVEELILSFKGLGFQKLIVYCGWSMSPALTLSDDETENPKR